MSTPYAPANSASLKPSVDFKANGEVSRMRSHKGNMPSLPQTKYCSLCPAKFTRTTHLNRHLRSHTNERSHRCNVCHAEFTRSDLLTRHKRTCGDSRNLNRSRRKSCQACAESKVKCNLQLPCSKCSSRGRECIFLNDPETSRNRKTAKKASSRSGSVKSQDESDSVDHRTPSISSPSSPFSILYPSPISLLPSPTDSLQSSPSSTNRLDSNMSFGLPSLCHSSGSSTSSSRSSSRLEPFDIPHVMPNLIDLNYDNLEIGSQLDDFFPIPNNPYDPSFMDEILASCSSAGRHRSPITNLEVTNSFFPTREVDESFSYHQPLGSANQGPFHGMSPLTSPSFAASPSSTHHFSATSLIDHSTIFGSSGSLNLKESETEDLGHYLYMFFTSFSTQLPLIHGPTWTMEGKHPMLVSAMQACGAVFVKTQSAMKFVTNTIATSRENLISEFSKPTSTLKDRLCLIVAVVLLQSLGLMCRDPEQSSATKLFHGILITMIRRIGLIRLLSTWSPPDLGNPYALDCAWRDWSRYETLKRVLLLAYVQDCYNCASFSTMPFLHPSEMEVNLPCDDALWTAGNVKDWYQMLQTPSPYAIGPRRLSAVNMRRALAALDDLGSSTIPLTLNPFSHFILIHTILRNAFAAHFQDTYTDDPPTPARAATPQLLESANLTNQYALHNWLQMWTNNPEAMMFEKSGLASIPFFCNATPFYWLAHYVIAASRDGLLDMTPATTEMQAQERCRLIDGWLRRIRVCLRNGSQLPPRIQDLLNHVDQFDVSQLYSPSTQLANPFMTMLNIG